MILGVNYIDLNQKHKAKQKAYDRLPNREKAKITSDHVNYIGRVEGTANNGEHSLFGTLANNDKINELLKEYCMLIITDTVINGAYIYKSVITLTQEDAEKYGYVTKEAFENLIRCNISVIAKEYNIKFENLDWVASFHTEEGHPHIHLVFYDNNNIRTAMPYVRYDNIKKELNKTVYRDDLRAIYENTNRIKKEIKNVFEAEINDLIVLNKNSMFDNYVSEANLNEVSSIIKEIYNMKKLEYKLTGKCSFKMQYQSPKVKAKIREATIKIIGSSTSIKQNIKEYVDYIIEAEKIKRVNLNKKNITNIAMKANEEMYKKVDNQVLGFIKEVIHKTNKELKNNNLMQSNLLNKVISNNLSSLYLMIYSLTKEESKFQKHLNRKTRANNQTKAAKREWYLKNRDRGLINWQEEM